MVVMQGSGIVRHLFAFKQQETGKVEAFCRSVGIQLSFTFLYSSGQCSIIRVLLKCGIKVTEEHSQQQSFKNYAVKMEGCVNLKTHIEFSIDDSPGLSWEQQDFSFNSSLFLTMEEDVSMESPATTMEDISSKTLCDQLWI